MALINNLDESDLPREVSFLANYADNSSLLNQEGDSNVAGNGDCLQNEIDFKRMFSTLEDGLFNLSLGLDEEKKFNFENSKLNQFFSSNANSDLTGLKGWTDAIDANASFNAALISAQISETNDAVDSAAMASAFEQFGVSFYDATSNATGFAANLTNDRLQAESQASNYAEISPELYLQQSYEFARLANEFKEKFDDVNTAISYYTKAIQLNGLEFRFYYNRSICLQQANLLNEALEDANAAIQLVPNARKPFLRKAEILVQMNKFSDAEQVLIDCLNLNGANDVSAELVQDELKKLIRTALLKFGFTEPIADMTGHCKSIEQAMDVAFNRQLEAKLNASNLFSATRPFGCGQQQQFVEENILKLGPISKSLDSQETVDYYTDEEALNLTPSRKFSFTEEQLFNYSVGSPVKKNGFCFGPESSKTFSINNQLPGFSQHQMQLAGVFGNNGLDSVASASGTSSTGIDRNQSLIHPSLMNKMSRPGVEIVRKRSSLSLSEPLEHFVKSFSYDPFMKNSFSENVNKADLNFSMMTNQEGLYSKSLGSSYSNLAAYMQAMSPNGSQGEEVQVDPKYKELVERNNRCTNLIGYKGLWLGNISSNCSRERLISIFRKYGDPIVHQLKKSPCVFIKYNNEKSPTDAIQDLHGKIIVDIVHNKNDPLRLHFECNRRQQEENFPKNKMARNFKNGECYFWRTIGCPQGKNCPKIHVPINEKIDFQMWMLNDPNHKVA